MKLNRIDSVAAGALAFLAVSTVTFPVCLPEMVRSIPMGLGQSGATETIRNIPVPFILILTALVLHRRSRKFWVTAAHFLITAGFLIAGSAASWGMLVPGLLLTGCGGGLLEAFINPLVSANHRENSGRYLNFINAFFPLGVIIVSILFGELLTGGRSWRTAFRLAAAGTFLFGLYAALPGYPKENSARGPSIGTVTAILKLPVFWRFGTAMFLSAGIEAAFTFWSRSYVDIFLSDVPRAGTLAVVLFSAGMMAGRLVSSFLAVRMPLKRVIIGSSVLGLVTSFFIFMTNGLAIFSILTALSGLAAACLWPSILSEAAGRMKNDGDVLLILLAITGMAGFAVTPFIIGLIGDKWDLKTGFVIIPVYFIILVVLHLRETKGHLPVASRKNLTEITDAS